MGGGADGPIDAASSPRRRGSRGCGERFPPSREWRVWAGMIGWDISEHWLFLMPLAHLWWLAVAGIAIDPAFRTDPSKHRGLFVPALVAPPAANSGRVKPATPGRIVEVAGPASLAPDHSCEKPEQESSGQRQSDNLCNREVKPGSLAIGRNALPYGFDHGGFVSACYRQV